LYSYKIYANFTYGGARCLLELVMFYVIAFIFQAFFDDVVSESDRDKNNIIKDIEELLTEKQVLEKVRLLILS